MPLLALPPNRAAYAAPGPARVAHLYRDCTALSESGGTRSIFEHEREHVDVCSRCAAREAREARKAAG